METAILDLCNWGWKNGASACVHLLNVLYCPKLHSCQRKHLYYEVHLLGILCALAHPLELFSVGSKKTNVERVNALSMDMHTNMAMTTFNGIKHTYAIYHHAHAKVFCWLRLMPVVCPLYTLRGDITSYNPWQWCLEITETVLSCRTGAQCVPIQIGVYCINAWQITTHFLQKCQYSWISIV